MSRRRKKIALKKLLKFLKEQFDFAYLDSLIYGLPPVKGHCLLHVKTTGEYEYRPLNFPRRPAAGKAS